MKHVILFVAAFCLLFSAGCRKKSTNGDYLIVYNMGGIAGGTHPPYFLLTNSTLAADTVNGFIVQPVTLNKIRASWMQSAAKFNSAKPLITALPAEMLTGSKNLGVQMIADGYTIIVTGRIKGKEYTWAFMDDLAGCSAEIKQYALPLVDLFK